MSSNNCAIVVQRVDEHSSPDTSEIERLTESAGYDIGAVHTQSRPEDREYNVGSGKVPEIYKQVQKHDADSVIVDNNLGPYQRYNLGIYMPIDVEVMDRYGIILRIFEQRATSKKSQLQVELAKLRHELPRADTKVRLAQREERPGFMGLGEYDKSRVRDIHDRIKRIRSRLSQIEDAEEKRRSKRKNQGFDLVAIAGYTNAGKSTLLRRLSTDHTVDENQDKHPDLNKTAQTTDNLFTTLDTTTRRMDFSKRDVLLTDTVGLIKDLPEWLVDAFRSTFENAYEADLVLLTVDVTKPVEEIRERVVTSHDVLSRNRAGRTITIFNKIDKIENYELDRKKRALESIAPNPVCISARDGLNVEKLKQRIDAALPPLQDERIVISLTEETMTLVSWIHDNTYVKSEEYTPDSVVIDFEAKPEVIQKVRHKANTIVTET